MQHKRDVLFVPEWPSSYFWPLLMSSGRIFNSFIRDYLVLVPCYVNISDIPSVFTGFVKFRSLALLIDFRGLWGDKSEFSNPDVHLQPFVHIPPPSGPHTPHTFTHTHASTHTRTSRRTHNPAGLPDGIKKKKSIKFHVCHNFLKISIKYSKWA